MRERGGPYYRHYVKGRDGRTVRRYVGGGPVAALAAQLDEIKRLERELEDLRLQEERQRLERSVGFLSGLEETCEVLVRAHLLAAGMHCRKGEWRQVREIRA